MAKTAGKWSLGTAERAAQAIVKKLWPFCQRIEVAGSIRRHRPWVNDIDLVLIPKDLWTLHQEILRLCQPNPAKMSGSKIMRIPVNGIDVDIYFADEKTWATLLLIRTGSAQNNIRLCSTAKARGMKLHADGSGLFKIVTCDVGTPREDRIAGDTELSIFQALGLKYLPPEERD